MTQGLHPRLVTEGFDLAKKKSLEVLEEIKVKKEMDRDTLINVARTSLRTKVHAELADVLTEVRLCQVVPVSYWYSACKHVLQQFVNLFYFLPMTARGRCCDSHQSAR